MKRMKMKSEDFIKARYIIPTPSTSDLMQAYNSVMNDESKHLHIGITKQIFFSNICVQNFPFDK